MDAIAIPSADSANIDYQNDVIDAEEKLRNKEAERKRVLMKTNMADEVMEC